MLVTTKYLLLTLFTIFSIFLIPSVSALSYDSYYDMVQSNYKLNQLDNWSLGNNIQEGDYFQYKICNDSNYNDTMYQIIYPYHCYVISLEFVKLLESHTGDTWIVQSYFTVGDTINNSTSPLILLIDPYTFEVSTDPFNKKIGASLENTIFSLSQYEKSLSIGTVWDEIDSYFTNKIPLEIKNKQSIQILNTGNYSTLEVSVLSYDIIIPSNVYLHNDYPFPLKAKLYSPNIIYPEPQELYYFELLEYSREFENLIENSTIQEDWELK